MKPKREKAKLIEEISKADALALAKLIYDIYIEKGKCETNGD